MSESPSVAVHGVECLSRMPGCELAEGAPDVRGWEVTSPTSAHVGVVKDLLVDLASMRVRYLDVVLDASPTLARRVLLPIGKVWINDVLDEVVIAATTSLDALPDYDPATFNRDFEHNVLAGFGESGGSAEVDFYSAPAFDDARFRAARRRSANCGRRETDAGDDACQTSDAARDAAGDATEAANGVELPVITDTAAD